MVGAQQFETTSLVFQHTLAEVGSEPKVLGLEFILWYKMWVAVLHQCTGFKWFTDNLILYDHINLCAFMGWHGNSVIMSPSEMQAPLPIQFPLIMLARQCKMFQVLGFLPYMWKTWMDPGFRLWPKSQLLQAFGVWTSRLKIFLYPILLSLSLCLLCWVKN